MRFRASAVALLATSALLTTVPAASLGATAAAASCNYPVNAPVADLGASPTNATAGQKLTAFGSLRKNDCAIKGANVQIQRRYVISGAPSGSWTTVARTTTDAHGLFVASVSLRRNIQIRAYIAAFSSYPRTISNKISVRVHTRITEAVARPGSCKLTFAGSTLPVKKHRTVRIQKRGPINHFHGWTTIAKATTNRYGNYRVTVSLACGRTYNTSALISSDTINYAGRSKTVWGVVAAH